VRRVKFVEAGSFRQLASTTVGNGIALRIGTVVELGGLTWRIVGGAANPNRSGDTLVFVEPLPSQPVPPRSRDDRRRRREVPGFHAD
jgi:hypothetical protein